MGAAEVIAFEEVRARKQWDTLRQQLHARFDQWLDILEQQWHEPPSTLAVGSTEDRTRSGTACNAGGAQTKNHENLVHRGSNSDHRCGDCEGRSFINIGWRPHRLY